ncbi:hypothetical protein F8271_01180 [Micromonospora sp. ALFpr18c]|nr:hypothetical protein F8271_01180 [Micromonospora sp. ALFpr18c]
MRCRGRTAGIPTPAGGARARQPFAPQAPRFRGWTAGSGPRPRRGRWSAPRPSRCWPLVEMLGPPLLRQVA